MNYINLNSVSLLTWLDIPLGVEDEEEDRAPLSGTASPNHNYSSMSRDAAAVLPIPPAGKTQTNLLVIDCLINLIFALENHECLYKYDYCVGNTPADKSVAAKAWSGFDTKYMKPLLTHSNPTLIETLPTWCASVARILTTTEQLAHHPGFQAGKNNIADADDIKGDDINDEESAAEIVFNQSNAGEEGNIFNTTKKNGVHSNQSSSDASDI